MHDGRRLHSASHHHDDEGLRELQPAGQTVPAYLRPITAVSVLAIAPDLQTAGEMALDHRESAAPLAEAS